MEKNTKEIYKELIASLESGKKSVMLTVCKESGEVSKSVINDADGEAWDNIKKLEAREDAITDGPVTHISENGTLTMIERYMPKPRLIILGGGHIALALCAVAKLVDFEIVVFDDRPMYANGGRFPEADEVICDDFSRLFERVKIRETDYVVIVTRGHKHDTECLKGVLSGTEPAYTGMIGSKRRVAIVMKQLIEIGYSAERIDRVYTPIGLKIGAVTPQEIAVAIVAQLIQVLRLEHGTPDEAGADIETAAALALRGEEADALLTILETKGSVPRETGAKMSMSYEGNIIGTIGGGCAEAGVMNDARTVIRKGGWQTVTVDMTDSAEEDGMVCGGKMTVLIEKAL